MYIVDPWHKRNAVESFEPSLTCMLIIGINYNAYIRQFCDGILRAININGIYIKCVKLKGFQHIIIMWGYNYRKSIQVIDINNIYQARWHWPLANQYPLYYEVLLTCFSLIFSSCTFFGKTSEFCIPKWEDNSHK